MFHERGVILYPLTEMSLWGLLMAKDGNPLAKWGLQAGQKAVWHQVAVNWKSKDLTNNINKELYPTKNKQQKP